MIARRRRRPPPRRLIGLLGLFALGGAAACRARSAPTATGPVDPAIDLAVDLAFLEPIVDLAPELGERQARDVRLFAMGALPRANGVGPGPTSDAGGRDAGPTR